MVGTCLARAAYTYSVSFNREHICLNLIKNVEIRNMELHTWIYIV